jgi:hypothetical protein
MNAFWWIILANWTVEERLELRSFVDSWMAAYHGVKQ